MRLLQPFSGPRCSLNSISVQVAKAYYRTHIAQVYREWWGEGSHNWRSSKYAPRQNSSEQSLQIKVQNNSSQQEVSEGQQGRFVLRWGIWFSLPYSRENIGVYNNSPPTWQLSHLYRTSPRSQSNCSREHHSTLNRLAQNGMMSCFGFPRQRNQMRPHSRRPGKAGIRSATYDHHSSCGHILRFRLWRGEYVKTSYELKSCRQTNVWTTTTT